MFKFHPKLFDTLRSYDRGVALNDLSAGITVGVLALPLAMAFAIASGMNPAAGIWTAIVAGLLVALFGGSRVQIAGPTGAFIPIVYAIVVEHGVTSLLLATMLAGVFLFIMGALRLGNMIRFIPLSVVIGFTNGIAVVIFLSQIKDFLGLPIDKLPGEFFAQMQTLVGALDQIHGMTLAFSLGSLLFLLLWNSLAARIRWMQRLPGPLAVLLFATLLNIGLQLPIDTIGSRFGGIPQGLFKFELPTTDLSLLGKLIAPAMTIALLGAIESLLSARVADQRIDDRHDPNQELMAQGIANVIAPLFGGFAATGAIARTATNIRSGGRTPIAGIVHALVLLAIVLVLAPLAAFIPLSTLAAIVVVVSINMGEWHALSPKSLGRYSLQYRTILLGTFFTTVLFDLTLAVEIGLLLASLFFMFRMSDLTRIEPIDLVSRFGAQNAYYPDGSARVVAYQLRGSLFFGAANKLENLLTMHRGNPQAMVLDMDRVINIDTTGLDILQTLYRNMQQRHARLVLCNLQAQPMSIVQRSGFAEQLGEQNLALSLDEAIARIHHQDSLIADT